MTEMSGCETRYPVREEGTGGRKKGGGRGGTKWEE